MTRAHPGPLRSSPIPLAMHLRLLLIASCPRAQKFWPICTLDTHTHYIKNHTYLASNKPNSISSSPSTRIKQEKFSLNLKLFRYVLWLRIFCLQVLSWGAGANANNSRGASGVSGAAEDKAEQAPRSHGGSLPSLWWPGYAHHSAFGHHTWPSAPLSQEQQRSKVVSSG